MAKAFSHPFRVQILMALNTPERELSPKGFSDETGRALGNVAYHFRVLDKLGFVELARTEKRRGSHEHFYKPVKRAMVWTEESADLPAGRLDGMAATVLRGFVEDAGAALDSGRFNDRNDRVLAWDKMWVDKGGWTELVALCAETLERAMAIEAACAARRAKGGEGFFATYSIAAYPTPAPPEDAD